MDEQEQLPLPDPGSLRRVVTLRRGGLAWLAAVERALDAIGVPVRGHFVVARAPEDLDTGPRARSRDPETSGAAAARAERGATRIERAALRAIGLAGSRGLTYAELQEATGIASTQQRLSDLARDGFVEPNGEERRTPRGARARAFVLTPRGLAEAAQPKRKENTR
jgi:hypothetical protein